MQQNRIHEVVVYHDESKAVAGQREKAHFLMFVPVRVVEPCTADLFGPERIERRSFERLVAQLTSVRRESWHW